MEPLAVGVHACERGGVRPGCVVAINGAGTIGCVTLMAALAYGASQVIVADVIPARLERAMELGAAAVVDARSESLAEAVMSATGWPRGGRRGRMLRPSRRCPDAHRCIGARRTCRPGRDGTAADKDRHGGRDGERGGPGYGLPLRQRILNGDRVDRQRPSPGSSASDGPILIRPGGKRVRVRPLAASRHVQDHDRYVEGPAGRTKLVATPKVEVGSSSHTGSARLHKTLNLHSTDTIDTEP